MFTHFHQVSPVNSKRARNDYTIRLTACQCHNKLQGLR